MSKLNEIGDGVATAATAIVFCILTVSACLALFVFEDISLLVGIGLATGAAFFGWLLFFAEDNTRVAVIRWFPWP